MSQQQQSSSSFLTNSNILDLDEIFSNFLPDELDKLLGGDNLSEGNQLPIGIPMAADPQGIPDEATNAFNMEQNTNIELIELGDNGNNNERKATEEEEENLNTNGNGPIDVLAECRQELEKVIYKENPNPDGLKVRLLNKSSGETKIFYLNYVQEGRIVNAVKFIKEAEKYVAKSPGVALRYLKCICPYCQESGIEFVSRTVSLLEQTMKRQNIRVQCIYCGASFQTHQWIKCHIKKYHWDFGENIVADKENLHNCLLSCHSNLETLEMDDIFINFLPDELDRLLGGENLKEGNQLPIDIPMAAEPQGIPDEATNAFNMEQDTNIELIERGDNVNDSERKATEEEEKNLNSNKNGPIDVLAESVKELQQEIHKKILHPDSLKVRLKDKYSGEIKDFYVNYVKDGRIINADNYNHEMKEKYMRCSHDKFSYRKCVCPYCQENGIEILGRSNILLDHMRRTQNIKIQCVYCITDQFFNTLRPAKDHVKKYHWELGENILEDKENSDE